MPKRAKVFIKESVPILQKYLLESQNTRPIQALIDYKSYRFNSVKEFSALSGYKYSTVLGWFKRYQDRGIEEFIKTVHQEPAIGRTLINRDGEVIFYENVFTSQDSDRLFQTLYDDVNWQQDYLTMMGRSFPIPRLTAWYGDRDKSYTYSGITMNPSVWTGTLLYVKEKVEPLSGTHFNSVLLNLYRDGRDSVAWHSDDEPELGKNPIIASVSFGGVRKFSFRHRWDEEAVNIDLMSGSLLLMRGETQHYWLHQLPKTQKEITKRINLTFRVII